MDIKPTIIVFGILIGYLLGVFVLFFDNSSGHASFAYQFSHFSVISNAVSNNQVLSERTTLPKPQDGLTQLWFFREQPLFLIWAIMHVIGVSLCISLCILNYYIQKSIRKLYHIQFKKLLTSFLLVFVSLGLIVWISYTTAYGFDYVAYLIPLHHSQIKIYTMEGLNYLTGAYSLINMVLIASVVKDKAAHITEDEFNLLKKLFNTSLFAAAIVIAYATLASGVLYKALNSFYYDLYDATHKSTSYFPVIIIITLGLINTFLLPMFYFPNAQVFKKLKELHSQNIVLSAGSLPGEKSKGNFWGVTNDMLETIKILLALLAPLLSGLFS